MKRVLAALLAALLVAGAIPAAATLGGNASAAAQNESAPGAAFAGVVGVQQAEVGNEVAQRALDQRFAAANSNASRAAVVADQTRHIDQRLAELEQRRASVEAAYENGSLTKAQRDARLAAIAAQVRALERQANQTARVAADLPAEALREHGVNVSQVRALAHQANELGGGAVAEAARGIAGENVGNGLGAPADRGKNASERGAGHGNGPDDAPGNSENANGKAGADASANVSAGENASVGTNASVGVNASVNATVDDGGPDGASGTTTGSDVVDTVTPSSNTTVVGESDDESDGQDDS